MVRYCGEDCASAHLPVHSRDCQTARLKEEDAAAADAAEREAAGKAEAEFKAKEATAASQTPKAAVADVQRGRLGSPPRSPRTSVDHPPRRWQPRRRQLPDSTPQRALQQLQVATCDALKEHISCNSRDGFSGVMAPTPTRHSQ